MVTQSRKLPQSELFLHAIDLTARFEPAEVREILEQLRAALEELSAAALFAVDVDVDAQHFRPALRLVFRC